MEILLLCYILNITKKLVECNINNINTQTYSYSSKNSEYRRVTFQTVYDLSMYTLTEISYSYKMELKDYPHEKIMIITVYGGIPNLIEVPVIVTTRSSMDCISV